MEVIYKKSFHKTLLNVPQRTQIQVKEVIEKLVQSKNLETSGVDYRKMQGFNTFYRIRVGDYRVGIEYIHPTVIVITILTRSTIYKKFPSE